MEEPAVAMADELKQPELVSGRARDSETGQPPRKKHKKNKKHSARPDSINWIKKRARTIERRFQKGENTMPEHVEKALQRELADHNSSINEARENKQLQKMIKKYHMIRFFERKKAARLEKQLREKLQSTTDPDEIASIQADLHIAEVDKNYAIYFPYMERYVSLYPVAQPAAADDKTTEKPTKNSSNKVSDKSAAARSLRSERPGLWQTVESAMEKGQNALIKLRDRRLGVGSRSKPPQRPSKHSFATKARTIKAEHDRRGQQQPPTAGSAGEKRGQGSGSNAAPVKRKREPSSDGSGNESDSSAFAEAE